MNSAGRALVRRQFWANLRWVVGHLALAALAAWGVLAVVWAFLVVAFSL